MRERNNVSSVKLTDVLIKKKAERQSEKYMVQFVRLLKGVKHPVNMVLHRSTTVDLSLSFDIEIICYLAISRRNIAN